MTHLSRCILETKCSDQVWWSLGNKCGIYSVYKRFPLICPKDILFDPTWPTPGFELIQDFIGTTVLTKVHEDFAINAATCVCKENIDDYARQTKGDHISDVFIWAKYGSRDTASMKN